MRRINTSTWILLLTLPFDIYTAVHLAEAGPSQSAVTSCAASCVADGKAMLSLADAGCRCVSLHPPTCQ